MDPFVDHGSARSAFRREKRAQRKRPSAERDDQFYSLKRWRTVRRLVLARSPCCAECERAGRVKPANEVHHIEDRRQRPDLAYTASNLEALCASCHRRETNRRRSASIEAKYTSEWHESGDNARYVPNGEGGR